MHGNDASIFTICDYVNGYINGYPMYDDPTQRNQRKQSH